MTHLRRIMLEELQRRHYSQATTQRYIRFVERFAQHFHSCPDRLGRQHIREYQAQFLTVQKLVADQWRSSNALPRLKSNSVLLHSGSLLRHETDRPQLENSARFTALRPRPPCS